VSAAAKLRRGWCPSVARPMPSGDGLLVRLSTPGGSVPPALARGIASCAHRFGNGLIDLTRRANLQLRGLGEATMPGLITELSLLDALPLADEPEVARNIVASPLTGLDPEALCDVRPIVRALRECLASEPLLRALPPKFGFIIEDGGRLGLDDIAADIRFKPSRSPAGLSFTVALGADEGVAQSVATCLPQEIPALAVALARAFLELRGAGDAAAHRMPQLVSRGGARRIFRAAGLEARHLPEATQPRGTTGAFLPERPPPIGVFDLGPGKRVYLGIGAPFGRLTAAQLDALAGLAEASGADIRLTPWRTLLVANLSIVKAKAMFAKLEGSGFVTEARDARLSIAACPGSPACANSTVSLRDDAPHLAPLAQELGRGLVGLHISGCAKGCARGAATKAVLVGRDGRYDLVLDGVAGDHPVLTNLTLRDAKAALARIVEERHAQHARAEPVEHDRP
jgi:precorrin-3B synthase